MDNDLLLMLSESSSFSSGVLAASSGGLDNTDLEAEVDFSVE